MTNAIKSNCIEVRVWPIKFVLLYGIIGRGNGPQKQDQIVKKEFYCHRSIRMHAIKLAFLAYKLTIWWSNATENSALTTSWRIYPKPKIPTWTRTGSEPLCRNIRTGLISFVFWGLNTLQTEPKIRTRKIYEIS